MGSPEEKRRVVAVILPLANANSAIVSLCDLLMVNDSEFVSLKKAQCDFCQKAAMEALGDSCWKLGSLWFCVCGGRAEEGLRGADVGRDCYRDTFPR